MNVLKCIAVQGSHYHVVLDVFHQHFQVTVLSPLRSEIKLFQTTSSSEYLQGLFKGLKTSSRNATTSPG